MYELESIDEQWLQPVRVSGGRRGIHGSVGAGRVGAPVDGDEYTSSGKGLIGLDQLLCPLQKPCCVS